MLEIKRHRKKNAFDGLISRVDKFEERIAELENISAESSKPKKQTEKRLKKSQNRIHNDYKILCLRCNINIMVVHVSGEKGKERERIRNT